MKRVICLLMSIALIAGIFNVYAADNKNVALDDEVKNFMTALDFADENTNFKKTCTRAEAAELAVRFAGLGTTAPAGFETIFKDLTSEDKRYAYITAVCGNGMMSSFNDGYFRPDDNIAFEDACRIFVKMAGYGHTFNDTYAMYAKRLGILKGVDTANNITVADMYQMAYNTFHIPYKETAVNSNGTSYEVSADTVLEYYHGLIYKQGTVTENELTSLWKEFAEKDDNHIKIDSDSYDYAANDLLGMHVKYYIDKTDKNMVYCAADNKNEIFELDAADITDFDGNTLKYEVGGKERKISVSKSIDVIYNGLAYPLCTDEEFVPQIGAIRFADNNGDGVYDVAFVEAYRLIIVRKTNSKENSVYDMYDGAVATAGEDGLFEIYSGEKAKDFSSLKKGDPLLVGESKSANGNYIRAITDVEKYSGTITALSEKKVKIDDKSFSLADKIRTDQEVSVGKAATAFIYNGRCIAVIMEEGFDAQFAYLFNLGVSSDLNEDMSVKLFTENEGETVYPLNKNTAIDGIKYKQADRISAVLKTSALLSDGDTAHPYCQPILFKLNANGEVSDINTLTHNADKETGEAFSIGYSGYARFFTYNDTFYDDVEKGLACSVEDTATMICAPLVNKADKAYYRFTSKSNLTNFNAWTIKAICLDESKVADFVILYEDTSYSVETYATPGVVTNKMTKQNAAGDAVSAVEVIESGAVKEYVLSDDCVTVNFDLSDLAIGDIIRYSKSSLDELLAIERDVNIDKIKDRLIITKEPNSYGDIGAEVRYAIGTVTDVSDKYVSHVRLFPDENFSTLTGFNNYVMYQHTVYLTYDSVKERVYASGAADIKTYKDFGENADKVIAMTQYGNLRLVYMIK